LLSESVNVIVELISKFGPKAEIPATSTETGPVVAPAGTIAVI